MEKHERRETGALARYQVISAYLALDPPRGQRRVLLEQLAARVWLGADGEPFQVSAETIRAWVRRYRHGGLAALEDKPRPVRGARALSPQTLERAVELKRQVPERSLDRIIRILELRFDPEALGELEVWRDGRFVERVRPFRMHTHRRPPQRLAATPDEPAIEAPSGRRADWLEHLVKRRDAQFDEPTPRQLAAIAHERREAADRRLCDLPRDELDPDAFLEDEVRDHLARFGPFEAERAARTLERLFDGGDRRDLHVQHSLDAIRHDAQGGLP